MLAVEMTDVLIEGAIHMKGTGTETEIMIEETILMGETMKEGTNMRGEATMIITEDMMTEGRDIVVNVQGITN